VSNWAVQDAKARFSEFLREAEDNPQVITYRGKPKFEVRAIAPKKKADAKPMSLLEALRVCPKVPEFKLPSRRRDAARKVEFD